MSRLLQKTTHSKEIGKSSEYSTHQFSCIECRGYDIDDNDPNISYIFTITYHSIDISVLIDCCYLSQHFKTNLNLLSFNSEDVCTVIFQIKRLEIILSINSDQHKGRISVPPVSEYSKLFKCILSLMHLL